MKKTLFFYLIILYLWPTGIKAEVLECKLDPAHGLPGDIISIKTKEDSSFGEEQGKVSVILSGGTTIKLEIKSWSKDEIKFIVPPRPEQEIVGLNVFINDEKRFTTAVKCGLYGMDLVSEAIRLKKKGKLSSPMIIDHLDYICKSELTQCHDPKGYFGKYPLTGDNIGDLTENGFESDFISKFAGHPQFVTIGASAIWLFKTADLVYAPMIRIFLKPRSYFYRYEKPYFIYKIIPHGLINFDRYDLNIGYTVKTTTTKDNDADEKKSYVLIGLSNQLNRSALLNIGYALIPGDTEGVETQVYAGITIDFNFLKEIGLIDK